MTKLVIYLAVVKSKASQHSTALAPRLKSGVIVYSLEKGLGISIVQISHSTESSPEIKRKGIP